MSMKQWDQSLIFIFSFINWGTAESEAYNIHDFALVRFKKVYNSGYRNAPPYTNCYSVSVKKHEAAKDLVIKIKVYSILPQYHETHICSEEWSDWKSMGGVDSNNQQDKLFKVEINVTASKVETIRARLYEDNDFTDFQLSAADGTVAVHKTFLAAHSDMFKTMLGGEWKETAEGRIEVEGATLQTLQHLKDYMYLGTLPDDGLQPLLLLARRYLIESLKKECIMKLSQAVTADNFYTLLEFAMANEIHELVHNIVQKTPDSILNDALKMKMQKQIRNADESTGKSEAEK